MDSSNGRTADSDSVSIGSNPISPAKNHCDIFYIAMLCPPILEYQSSPLYLYLLNILID